MQRGEEMCLRRMSPQPQGDHVSSGSLLETSARRSANAPHAHTQTWHTSKCGQCQGGGAGDGLREIWFAIHPGRSCRRGGFQRLGTRLGEGRGGVAAAVAAAAAAVAAAAAAASSSSAYSDLHLSLATAKAFNCNHMRNSVARMLTLTAKHLECIQRFERSAAGIDRSNM